MGGNQLLQLFVLLLLQAAAGFHVTFVVAVCRESRLHFLDTAVEILRASGHNHSAQTIFYCKCTENTTRDGRPCFNLPNTGREVHTYFHHIVSSYDTLQTTHNHILFFINGAWPELFYELQSASLRLSE